MSHAFDETFPTPILDAETIARRVEDWQHRVDNLFSRIREWCGTAGLVARDSEPVRMIEELMIEHGIDPVQLPTLYVDRDGVFLAKIVPFGLWTIGANGRVDLKTRQGVFAIVDMAETFATPKWRLAGPGFRDAPPLSEKTFVEALLS